VVGLGINLLMVAEIIGGVWFGSVALVADGLHMSTHAGALLIAALAYTYSRRYAGDERFVFGTGKLGDLAAFTSAIALAMIALLIGYEADLLTRYPLHSIRRSRLQWSDWASTSLVPSYCVKITTTITPMLTMRGIQRTRKEVSIIEITTCAPHLCTCWLTPPSRCW
jgi:phosphatidylglycerophosphate synthase